MAKRKKDAASMLLFPLLAVAGRAAAAAHVAKECEAGSGGGGSREAAARDVDGSGGDAIAGVRRYECEDRERGCAAWARMGKCEKNPDYMLVNCPISCNSCREMLHRFDEEEGLLDAVARYGKPQRVEGPEASQTLEVIRKTIAYMQNNVYGPNPKRHLSEDILAKCVNHDELCAFWSAMGECETNVAYMKVNCAPSCRTCEMIDIRERCPPPGDDSRPAISPGGLNAMFERIARTAPGNRTDGGKVELEDGMTNYAARVHSRPAPFEGEPIVSVERDLEQPPWVIVLDDFLTEEECERMIELGHRHGYERSQDIGAIEVDGSYGSTKSVNRTSEKLSHLMTSRPRETIRPPMPRVICLQKPFPRLLSAWCSYRNGCRNDAIARRIHKRIERVTGIPQNHSEVFQLLKYEVGQFYRRHHDYVDQQRDRRCGPRILTFFLYLNDVEEGGETHFPDLGITVRPNAGRALLWPSVLDGDPRMKETRTDHEAREVIRGRKYGANVWIHLHDFVKAQEMGCT